MGIIKLTIWGLFADVKINCPYALLWRLKTDWPVDRYAALKRSHGDNWATLCQKLEHRSSNFKL